MRRSAAAWVLTIILVMGFSSCSNEEVTEEPQKKMGRLSFGGFLNNFSNNSSLAKSNEGAYDIPECSDEAPLFVYVSMKVFNGTEWVWYKNSNDQKIRIDVNPNGTDLDGNGSDDAWFTQESADLELEEGRYRIEYFAVASGTEPSDIIYLAPRLPDDDLDYGQNIQYHNFVDQPLPIEVNIPPGAKYYQPVEVLCYEEHYAFAFGYLFFDFNNTSLVYLCTYGNVCDEEGRHIPAQFKMKVWKDASETTLLVVAQNERRTFSNDAGTHYYADALCFPLPVLEDDNEEYFAKIWLLDDDAETLIRQGSFGAEELSHIFMEEQEYYYYHFREACCEASDNFPFLEDLTENEGDCEEQPQDPECNSCEGKITKLTFEYLGEDDTQVTIHQNSNKDLIEIFDDVLDNGEIFSIAGQFNNGQQPYTLWTEIYLEEDGGEVTQFHTSCSDPDVVPGLIRGNFKIISGESAEGGLICPDPQ